MAYSDLTLAIAKQMFGLTLEKTPHLFTDVEGIQPSEFLTQMLLNNVALSHLRSRFISSKNAVEWY